ncbi:FAS1-like dehydratase domain-containing protein [Aeromicrobium sp. CF3.5]|uniref:FAS1-like dehydratase domain-containing protein n=1 Tax=Aeromicrobium sp. CF3.5 TaxID=3373078 RepID=UPI003EE64159
MTLEHGPVAALTALLDSGAGPLGPGDPLPPLWHWVALPQWPTSSMLSTDGHPDRGALLPAIDLPRRMFAGGSTVLHAPLTVGAAVRREERVVSVVPKQGRSGPLVLVDVESRLHDAETDTLLVEEHRHLVFRERATASTSAAAPPLDQDPAGPPLRSTGPGTWDVATDPTLLMRFSAATANPHRIHYDWPYATGIEGYPGLVVHGPLTLLMLIEALRLHGTPIPPGTALEFRNLSPLTCGEPAEITLSPDGTSVTLSTPGERVVTRLDIRTPTDHQPDPHQSDPHQEGTL